MVYPVYLRCSHWSTAFGLAMTGSSQNARHSVLDTESRYPLRTSGGGAEADGPIVKQRFYLRGREGVVVDAHIVDLAGEGVICAIIGTDVETTFIGETGA